MAKDMAITKRQLEVALLYSKGYNDVATGNALGLTRERIRQLRAELELPVQPRQQKARPLCLVCGTPVKRWRQRYCSLYCRSYALSKYLCPICQELAKVVGSARGGYYYYYKCRSGHNLRRTEGGLVQTRQLVAGHSCPICQKPAPRASRVREHQYYKCPAGHYLKLIGTQLIPTKRTMLTMIQAILDNC